ncbi:MAG: efflux RND transporter periplasmic adaptor subunit, partial [Flavobacterium sp.]|nr:efflux RND transporter periplasmic adaptor subunit [Flavobacterium sp.]
MKKIFFMLLSVAILASCSSNKADEKEQIKKEIEQQEAKLQKIKQKISDLKVQLGDDTIDNRQKFSIPVRLQELDFEVFNHFIEVAGTVEAVNEAYISPELNGQIKKIHVKEGDRVKKGQLLATINTSVLDNSIDEIKTGLELAKKIFAKQKELWDQKIGSEIQYLEAKNARDGAENRLKTLESQIEMAKIRAPFDGIVDEIYHKEGELAVPGMQIIQLVNLSTLKINADVSESYLPYIKKG